MCGQSGLDEIVVVDSEDIVQDRKIKVTLPEGLVLNTRRVGESVAYAEQVLVGETVRFSYSGGSEDGERNVLVVKVDIPGESFEGLTLERDGEYRKYLDGKIDSRILIVEPFVKGEAHVSGSTKRVRFDEAGVALLASLTGEQLADLYAKHVAVEGDGASYDPDSGEVVVMLPAPKENKFTKIVSNKDNAHEDMVITNKKDQKFKVYFYSDDSIGLHNDATGFDNSYITPEELSDELVKFLA